MFTPDPIPRPAGPPASSTPLRDYFAQPHPGMTEGYAVLPRSLVESMPLPWQQQLTHLLAEFHQAFGHLNWPIYRVQPSRYEKLADLDEDQLAEVGCIVEIDANGELVYRERNGRRITNAEEATVLVSCLDPIPATQTAPAYATYPQHHAAPPRSSQYSPQPTPQHTTQPHNTPPRGTPQHGAQPYPTPAPGTPRLDPQPYPTPAAGTPQPGSQPYPTFPGGASQPYPTSPSGTPPHENLPDPTPPRGTPRYESHPNPASQHATQPQQVPQQDGREYGGPRYEAPPHGVPQHSMPEPASMPTPLPQVSGPHPGFGSTPGSTPDDQQW